MTQKTLQAHIKKYQILKNATDKSIKGMKIGIPKEYEADGISEDISEF